MAKPTLLLTRLLPPDVEARAARDYSVRNNPADDIPSAEELIERAQGCDAILTLATERFSAPVIERLPESVRMIATFSVGYEHIDLGAARARGIRVSNTPDVLTEATADIALLCLLGAARRGWEAQTMLREDRWAKFTTMGLVGLELNGKTLGIVGMGRIGRAVARRARGFGMKIRYHNRSRLPAGLEEGAIYHETAEDMLPHCQFLSLNAPAGPGIDGFLNSERIALLPEQAVVVNTARGTLIDDEALIAALKAGRIFAAGLDVFAGEPNINPAYRTLPNVYILPHIGSATIETRNAMGFRALDNLDAFFAGREPPHAIA